MARVSMMTSSLIVSGSGIEAYSDLLEVTREEADALSSCGVVYEEEDRREAFLAALAIALITSALTTAAAEIVKRVVARLSDALDAQAPQERPQVTIVINNISLELPPDRDRAVAEVERLVAPE
jgi:hypothetical protein